MELKYSQKRWELGQWESSNRTFMELKLHSQTSERLKYWQVLIVPLWN